MGNMKHQQIVETAGMRGEHILGGTIWQKGGKVMTNELSGSFHQNWNEQTRQQFKTFMSEHGVLINHSTRF